MKPDDREFSNNLVFIASIGNAALKKSTRLLLFYVPDQRIMYWNIKNLRAIVRCIEIMFFALSIRSKLQRQIMGRPFLRRFKSV